MELEGLTAKMTISTPVSHRLPGLRDGTVGDDGESERAIKYGAVGIDTEQ